MSYSTMTKAQLIDRITELEKQTVQAHIDNIVIEAMLAWEDAVKLVKWVYSMGQEARKSFAETVTVFTGSQK